MKLIDKNVKCVIDAFDSSDEHGNSISFLRTAANKAGVIDDPEGWQTLSLAQVRYALLRLIGQGKAVQRGKTKSAKYFLLSEEGGGRGQDGAN